MAHHTRTRPPTVQTRHREKVLLLLYSDGYVECFANKHVDVHITNVPHASTPATEILAEEYVGLMIPPCYREVYFPSYRRAAEQVRKTTAEDIINREYSVELLRAIQAIGDDRKGGRQRWTL